MLKHFPGYLGLHELSLCELSLHELNQREALLGTYLASRIKTLIPHISGFELVRKLQTNVSPEPFVISSFRHFV